MTETSGKTISYPERLRRFEKNAHELLAAQPAVMTPFWKVHAAAVGDGVLDTKTKELIALAISVAVHCDDCIAHHTYDALNAGATKEEIADTLGVAVLMGGGASVVYATHAIEALEEFSQRAT
jgi:AhpD family alkylhydroperoxidase